MTPGIAQEQLQRVGRRLVRRLERGRRRLLLLVLLLLDQLDPSPLELVEECIRLERVELVQLDELGQVGLPNRARDFCVLQQRLNVLVLEDRLDFDLCHRSFVVCLGGRSSKRHAVRLGRQSQPRTYASGRMHANLRYVKSAKVGLILALVLLALPGRAKAELVAPTQSDALLAVAPDGTPRVAYTSGRDVVVARRTTAGWRFARAGRVPGTRPVLAGLVVDARGRTSVLVEGQTGGWLALAARGGKVGVVARPRRGASFGPSGLTLDAAGRPAFRYAPPP